MVKAVEALVALEPAMEVTTTLPLPATLAGASAVIWVALLMTKLVVMALTVTVKGGAREAGARDASSPLCRKWLRC